MSNIIYPISFFSLNPFPQKMFTVDFNFVLNKQVRANLQNRWMIEISGCITVLVFFVVFFYIMRFTISIYWERSQVQNHKDFLS